MRKTYRFGNSAIFVALGRILEFPLCACFAGTFDAGRQAGSEPRPQNADDDVGLRGVLDARLKMLDRTKWLVLPEIGLDLG